MLHEYPRLPDVSLILILILSAAPTPSELVPLEPVRWLEKPTAMDSLLSVIQKSLA